MPDDSITFRNDDLVLRVREDFDPSLLNLDQYEAFIDALCGDREYQKEAIRVVCRFLAGGQYALNRKSRGGELRAEPEVKPTGTDLWTACWARCRSPKSSRVASISPPRPVRAG